MDSHEHVITSNQRIRHFPKGFGRRSSGGSALAAAPVVQWSVHARGSAGRSKAYVLRGGSPAVAPASTRRIAASLWWSVATTDCSGSVTWRSGLFDHRFKFYLSSPVPEFMTEECTKWDYCYSNDAPDDVNYLRRHPRLAAVFKKEKCIDEVRAEGAFRARINHCIKRLDKERASKRNTERENMRSIVKDLADDIKKERSKCKKFNIVNSKLLNDIVGAKLAAWKFLQKLEREKRTRALLENKSDELGKYIEGSRAEIAALRNQGARIDEEIKEERKMLQMAEAWREECVQMKLVDVKLILEDKLAKINNLIVDCEAIMRPSNSTACGNLKIEVKGTGENSHGFSHHRGDYTSSDHQNNVHELSENNRSGKETETQVHISSSQTLGNHGDRLWNIIRSGLNVSRCDAKCRNKALGGSQRPLKSSEISSVSFQDSENITSSSSVCMPRNEGPWKTIKINGIEKFPSGWISSNKHQLSPHEVSGKWEYDNHNLASPPGSTHQRENLYAVPSKKGPLSPRKFQMHGSAANLPESKSVSQKIMLVRDVLEQRS